MCALRWVKEITAPRVEHLWHELASSVLRARYPLHRVMPLLQPAVELNSSRSLSRKATDLRVATVSIEWMPASRSDVMAEGYGTGTMDSRSSELAVQRRKDSPRSNA